MSIAAIILVFVYISKLKSENERMRAVLPHMPVGDNINYFDLISTDALEIDSTEFDGNGIVAIFIF